MAKVGDFEVVRTPLSGVVLLQPVVARDDRGWFMRAQCAAALGAAGVPFGAHVQTNQSRSRRGTVRGLHFRRELRENKIVHVTHGRIFDVVVDLRPWSPSFLRWQGFELDDHVSRQVVVPPGCAHGFQALSEVADVAYYVDAAYDPAADAVAAWDDPELAIDWPLPDPIVSSRDRDAPAVRELLPQLDRWFRG